jgi:two-component system response regulator HydG
MNERLSVLVVDDDRDLAESLADVFEARGHDVALAYSGESGLEIFREREFDIVFMDVKLPGMSGVETFFAFRQLKPDARVMMMTGYSVEQLLQQAIDAGALGVLRKPFAMTDVLEALERARPHGVVLVADDDPDFTESLRPVLQAAGWRVAVAATGQAAVERVSSGGIDCLILDLRLPILSGFEVYLQLKKLGIALPTVIVTGHAAEEGASAEGLRADAEDFLVKPVDPRRLVSALEAAVR